MHNAINVNMDLVENARRDLYYNRQKEKARK